jgi:Tat protein translocase TatB subunit
VFNIGTPELLVILVIALIVVGPRRLPEIGRQVGRAMAELRKVQNEVRDMVKFDLSDDTSDIPDTTPIPTPHVYREIEDDELSANGNGSVPEAETDAPADGPTQASEQGE